MAKADALRRRAEAQRVAVVTNRPEQPHVEEQRQQQQQQERKQRALLQNTLRQQQHLQLPAITVVAVATDNYVKHGQPNNFNHGNVNNNTNLINSKQTYTKLLLSTIYR